MTDHFAVFPAANSKAAINHIEQIRSFCPPILDTTFGQGNFWADRSRVVGLDIASPNPDVRGVWEFLPFRDATFNTVIFDPPHTADDGKAAWRDAFGQMRSTDYTSAFAEFRRVMSDDGLLVAKTADMVHGQRASWLTLTIIQHALTAGFRLEDWLISFRSSVGHPNTWKTVRHARKNHSHWLLFTPIEAPLW